VRTIYTEDRQPGIAKTCFKTIHTLLNNLMKDPTNDKFKRVNMANEAIKARIVKITGGLIILKGAGFVENDVEEVLVIDHVNENLIKEGMRLLENNL